MNLRFKLMGSFALVLLLTAVVGFVGIWSAQSISAEVDEFVDKWFPSTTGLMQLDTKTSELRWNQLRYITLPDKRVQAEEDIENGKKAIQEKIDWFTPLATSEVAQKAWPQFIDNYNKYLQANDRIVELVESNQIPEALKVYDESRVFYDNFNNASLEIANFDRKQADETGARAQTAYDTGFTIIVGVLIAAILLGLIIGFVLSNAITKPVNQIRDMLKDMAEAGGDLTKRITVSVKDEIGDLANWFNAFLDNLHDIMAQVKQSSETVSAAANETSLGNQDLSQRTEEQASSLEEISSTIEEIAASLQKSSESSTDADRISRTTLETVKSSEEVVGEMQGAMSDITKGSHEIAEIIAKVNDIAFQTNLLALNAAVEAARAGEQGRGFAVVAAEVRNLAGRTAESAKEIEGLIKDSITRVDKGNQLMDEVSKVLGDVVTNTEHTTEVIMEIAASMKEQSSAAEDIRSAVEQMNQVTQQNASLVEEIAGSSEAVSNEAEELSALVGKFKLRDTAVIQSSKRAANNPAAITKKQPNAKPRKAGPAPAHKMAAASSDQAFNEDDFEKF